MILGELSSGAEYQNPCAPVKLGSSTAYLSAFGHEKLPDGRQRVVRNGHLPERQILTGLGEVEVRVPKSRSRSGSPTPFRSSVVPPYIRRCASLDAAIPWLYLHGVSTGQMRQAVGALVGEAHAAVAAVEERHANVCLEHADAVRDRGEGDTQFLRCAHEALMASGGIEEAQAVEGRERGHGLAAVFANHILASKNPP